MKKLMFCFFLFTAVYIQAQVIGIWSNIRHSSYTINNELHVRSEIIPVPDASTDFYYFQGSDWINQTLIPLNEFTHEAIIPVDPAEIVQCRFRTQIAQSFDGLDDLIPNLPDSVMVMMTGHKINDGFPPVINELPLVAEDPIGDIETGMPDYLDITAQYFTKSDSRLYTAISNNSNDFPTGPLLGPFNVYASLIINPDTVLIDSVLYAMVYGQIPVVLTPGLYRFAGLNIDAISRIGNIEHQIINNNLIMACSLDQLTSDPYFGDWPNLTNSLIFTTITMQISLSMEYVIADVGQIGLMVMEHYIIEPFINVLPGLFNVELEEMEGNTAINLTYYDTNGNFPLIAEVVLDNEQVYQFQPLGYNYQEPVNFTTLFSGEWSNGLIRFSDNGYEMVEQPIYSNVEEVLLPVYNEPVLTLYPNPFYPTNNNQGIQIIINDNSLGEEYQLAIYDIRGRLVYKWRKDINFDRSGQIHWDGRDSKGNRVSSGLYFVRYLNTNTKQATSSRVLIIK